MKYKFLLLSCFTLFISLSSYADGNIPGVGGENVKKSDIIGGVYDTDNKKPISNVSVSAYVANKKEKVVLTDAKGNYSFEDLKPGKYKFVFEKDGYKKATKEKTIAKVDEALQLNISLEEHSNFDFMPGPSHFYDH